MMSNLKFQKKVNQKMLLAFPIAVLLLTGMSCDSKKAESNDQKAVTENTESTSTKMPEFKGGYEALTAYMINNIKYPESAKQNGVTGVVKVKFNVTKEGKIAEAKVIESIGNGCDEEALRVISEMPDWIPATDKGQAVEVELVLPVSFKLEDKTNPQLN